MMMPMTRVDDHGTWWQRLHIDPPLMLGLMILSVTGLVVLYSAGGQNIDLVARHALRLLIAFGFMLLLAQIDPRHFFHWTPWVYAVAVLLLVAVMMVGEIGMGALRCLQLGPLNFHPSEIAKITVPLMVAYYLSDKLLPPRLGLVSVATMIVLVPTALVARQPDLGTALLIVSSGAFVLFFTGLSWRVIASLFVLIAVCAPGLWAVMHDYQRARVITLFNPEMDPLGTGYHIIQSKIAIGSGGMYGKGWLNGTQSRLEFVPERSTDFVFAVFGEEFGLLGVAVLLGLYLFVIFRGLHIALSAQELFGRLAAGGLTLTFFVYVFVNIGMVSGLLPVVGLPLPLMSYGGTALVTVMGSFGILMSIHTHRRLLSEV
jgi:rod shape determining protein RodA